MPRLIAIGYTGDRRCYLNVSREEAVRRYEESEGRPITDPTIHDTIQEFEFVDEFRTYEVWEASK